MDAKDFQSSQFKGLRSQAKGEIPAVKFEKVSDVNSVQCASMLAWQGTPSNLALDFLIHVLLMDFINSSKGYKLKTPFPPLFIKLF